MKDTKEEEEERRIFDEDDSAVIFAKVIHLFSTSASTVTVYTSSRFDLRTLLSIVQCVDGEIVPKKDIL